MANAMNVAARAVRSPAEAEAAAREWVAQNPIEAQAAHDDLYRILSEAPIHAALLGEFGARHNLPKPVSAFVRLYRNEFHFIPSGKSRTGSPAICLLGKENDYVYWTMFRRKGLEASADQPIFNPWAVLGISNATAPFGETRIRIFEAFLWAHYGISTLKDMATVCADFRRESGVPFASFFNGLRPAEFQKTPLASERFTWSWSTDNPPCLSCAVKSRYALDIRQPSVVPNGLHVAALTKEAAKKLPEDIDFARIAMKFNITETAALAAYIPALRSAVQFAMLNISAGYAAAQFSSTPNQKGGSSLAQLYRQAQTVASAVEALMAEIKRLDPTVG